MQLNAFVKLWILLGQMVASIIGVEQWKLVVLLALGVFVWIAGVNWGVWGIGRWLLWGPEVSL